MGLRMPSESLFLFQPDSSYDPDNDLVAIRLFSNETVFARLHLDHDLGRYDYWSVDPEFVNTELAAMQEQCGGKELVIQEANQLDYLVIGCGKLPEPPVGSFRSAALIMDMRGVHRRDAFHDNLTGLARVYRGAESI